ncbi:MAG: tetratricopeptide repeat protein, partial [Candidatus Obscuribacterales bacterium]|nr:tetratricopeptide repeat protein [Candidatus Obscuribacterales bacterium]
MNTQPQMAAIGNLQSFVPDFTVQIVQEPVPSILVLEAVLKTLEGGVKAGRMGGIVPLTSSNLNSKLKPISAELSEQLATFARSEQGARCQRLFGNLDIQKSETYPISQNLEKGPTRIVVQEQVQAVLDLHVLLQGLEGGAKAGRMKGIVPVSASNLGSKLKPLSAEVCHQIDEFVRSEQGARCQRLLGHSDIQKSETYPISQNLEKTPTPITETDLALIKALVLRHEAKAAAKAAETKANDIWVQQQFRNSQAQANSQPIITKSPKENNVRQLEARGPKEKFLRHAIMCVANVCLLISCAAEIMHLVNRQSEQNTAMQKLAAGDLPAAKICYEKIIQSQPQNWEAYLGHASAVPNDYAKQVADYNHVLALNPGESHATFGLAKSYYELGDYKNAIGFANRAYAQSSKSEPLEIKAKSLMRLQKFDDASKVFKQILAKPSKHSAEQYYMLASCQKELGNRKQQGDYLRKALAVAPKNVGYLNELAMVLAADSKFND